MSARAIAAERSFAPPRFALALGWGLPLLILLAVAVLATVAGRPVADLTRDPLAVAILPPYLGLLSNVSVLLWGASAVLAWFAAALGMADGRRDPLTLFLALLGVLSAVLMTDDMFMLHEWLFPMVLGLPQWLPLAGEAGLLAVLLVAFHRVYLPYNLFFLGSALAGFGGSVLIDHFPDHWLPGHYLLEDGLKLIGIVNWLGFTAQMAGRRLTVRSGAPG